MSKKITYRTKIIILLSLISALSLIYIFSFIFSPEARNTRSSMYTWLDAAAASKTQRITVSSPLENMEIVKRNERWFIIYRDMEFPARSVRIEDFLGVFTERGSWTVRYTSADSHERLGLNTGTATRLTFYDENSVLMDLMIGMQDTTGQEIFIRRYGQNEVRSGRSQVVSYLTSPMTSWYNLRLIPETESGSLNLDNVQRLSANSGDTRYTISRSGREWSISGLDVENPDHNAIETYIRGVLNTEGMDFVHGFQPGDNELNHSRIVLEFGNGETRTIRLSDFDENNHRFANVAGTPYVYVLAPWAGLRLISSPDDFEMRYLLN